MLDETMSALESESDASQPELDSTTAGNQTGAKRKDGSSYFEQVKKRSRQDSTIAHYGRYLNKIKRGMHDELNLEGDWSDVPGEFPAVP